MVEVVEAVEPQLMVIMGMVVLAVLAVDKTIQGAESGLCTARQAAVRVAKVV